LDFSNNAKISDFGLSRAVESSQGQAYYYRMTPGGVMPFKWSVFVVFFENATAYML